MLPSSQQRHGMRKNAKLAALPATPPSSHLLGNLLGHTKPAAAAPDPVQVLILVLHAVVPEGVEPRDAPGHHQAPEEVVPDLGGQLGRRLPPPSPRDIMGMYHQS